MNKRFVAILVAALALFAASGARSQSVPQTGYWWTPGDAGNGLFVEQQGNTLFAAQFLYASSGRSNWYAIGPSPLNTNLTFAHYLDGQTLLGAYQPPVLDTTPVAWAPLLSFSSPAVGEYVFAPISRFAFGTGSSLASDPGMPTTGIWWAPTEPGRGYTIEVQGNTMFFAAYMYDTSGNPVWYTSGPTPMSSTSLYQGTLQQFAGGTVLDGKYMPATVSNANAGNITLQFSDPDNATLTLPSGRQVAITHYIFGGFSLSPGALDAVLVPGASRAMQLTVGPLDVIAGTPYAAVSDSAGVLLAAATVTRPGSNYGPITLTVNINPNLVPGVYNGNASVNVCLDATCFFPVFGSPVNLPYSVTVQAPPALNPIAGASDWATFQGNAGHTGFVPATLDHSRFTLLWTWTPPVPSGYTSSITTVATGDGQVYAGAVVVTSNGFYQEYAYAVTEASGNTAWQHQLGTIQFGIVNPPAYAAGRMYLVSGTFAQTVWGFDAASGAVLFQSPMQAQYDTYLAPTVSNGLVYTDSGAGGMFAYDAVSGAQKFFTALPQFDDWTPAVDGNYAYAYVGVSNTSPTTGAHLFIIDSSTGVVSSTISDASYVSNYFDSMHSAPVLGAAGSLFTVDIAYPLDQNNDFSGRLVKFDLAQGNIAWAEFARYTATPAYAAGMVYAPNGSPLSLEARDANSGELMWSWTPTQSGETAFIGSPVVTNNLVFASTNVATYAIDFTTHAPVWSYPRGGNLALSANGVLYIATVVNVYGNWVSDGNLLAIRVN